MFDYLQKFNNLPKELRDKVSSPEAMSFLAELEKRYQVDLAIIVMKVMVKILDVKNLTLYFVSDLGLDQKTAENLDKELLEKIFSPVADYLGLAKEVKALDLESDISLVIREVGLILPSSDLVSRLKTILSTYLKGIRNKVSTRDALAKPVNLGGLSLSAAEIDRLFKVCEQKSFKSLDVTSTEAKTDTNPLSRLDKIIASAEMGTEYNLKQAIALGQIKKPEHIFKLNNLDTKHELEAPDEELKLEAPEKELELEAPKKELKLVTPVIAPVITPVKPVIPTVPATPIKPVTPVISVTPAKPMVPATPVAPALTPKPIISNAPVITPKPAAPVKPLINKTPKQNIFSKIKSFFNKPKTVSIPKVVSPIKAVAPVIATAAAVSSVKNIAPVIASAVIKPIIPAAPAKPTAPIIPASPIKPITPVIPVKPVTPIISTAPIKPIAPATTPIKPLTPPHSPLGPIAASRPVLSTAGSKQAMHDIKVVPKVMGPLEELQFLDLLNFRRLGKTPEEITAKIFAKIKLLEVDGYDKMVAGVRAWRQSPVNHLYLKMMKEAINKGLTIKDFAVIKQAESKDYLSLVEIEAILLMNSKLIF